MSKKDNNYLAENFFDVLCENDEDKIHEYILTHGKAGKAISPIIFMEEEMEETENER